MIVVCKCCLNKRGQKASRAGTGGFRPPEVLLKYSKQDQKLDIWAAGVCLLTLLSRRFEFYTKMPLILRNALNVNRPLDVSAILKILALALVSRHSTYLVIA